MKQILAIFEVHALVAPPVLAGESDAVSKAQAAANSWLALTDSGKYAES